MTKKSVDKPRKKGAINQKFRKGFQDAKKPNPTKSQGKGQVKMNNLWGDFGAANPKQSRHYIHHISRIWMIAISTFLSLAQYFAIIYYAFTDFSIAILGHPFIH